jgi:transposase
MALMTAIVAMIFSFLETMRLQGKNAVEELFKLLVGGRYPPQTDFVLSI